MIFPAHQEQLPVRGKVGGVEGRPARQRDLPGSRGPHENVEVFLVAVCCRVGNANGVAGTLRDVPDLGLLVSASRRNHRAA